MTLKALKLLSLGLLVTLFAACSTPEEQVTTVNEGENEENQTQEEDGVTGATRTIVVDEASLFEGLGEDGGWILTFEADVTVDKDLVLEGDQTNKGELARKIALYEQDADRNVTASYTLTAPKLTVKSENSKIQNGTFVGDIYVEANKFQLVNTTVEGNVYFASEEYKASSEISDDSKVTGSIEVSNGAEATDGVTGATRSIVVDEASLFEGLGEAGGWILTFEADVTVDKDLVLEGNQTNKDELARKIALYEQDADRNVTASYTLTAPKLTVKNENAKIQNGTFVGDIYVEANKFQLVNTTVEGNVYFASEEYKASSEFSDDSKVTGSIEVSSGAGATDGVTGATRSIVVDEASLFEGVGEAGGWILTFEADVTVDKDLVLEGNQTNKDELARKIALYEQDSDRNVTASYTLTAPKLTVKNENAKIQNGTFVGDIYVEANKFQLVGTTVEGNVYFASEEFKASAEISDDSKVTGSIEVK